MRCFTSLPWFGPMLPEPLGNDMLNPTVNPLANSLFQLSPHSYNLTNNELEAKFSVDLEMSFWRITLGQRVQKPFFLYISCVQHQWDTPDLCRAFGQWLWPQGLFIPFIKNTPKPHGWFLEQGAESCSSTFHTHALFTALTSLLINPSNSTNHRIAPTANQLYSPGSSDTLRRTGEVLWIC